MAAPRLHAFIISWRGQAENATRIEAGLASVVDRLTVIHSDETPDGPLGERWLRVPNDWFYGRKFQRCLEAFEGDVMLQIVADVSCDDWAGLARRCRDAYADIPELGLWTAEVDGTTWTLERTRVARVNQSSLYFVTRVDSIVWALSADVLARLRGLDFDANNLGWGIEKLAALHCHVTGKVLVLDQGARVIHPPGSGYSTEEALAQSRAFLAQATVAERVHDIIAHGYMERRKR